MKKASRCIFFVFPFYILLISCSGKKKQDSKIVPGNDVKNNFGLQQQPTVKIAKAPEIKVLSGVIKYKFSDPVPVPNIFSYEMKQLGTENGLLINSVRSGCVDKEGNVWFGTQGGGAAKYDGKFVTNFTALQGLNNNGIWSIYCDSKGNVWFGSRGGGASSFDGTFVRNFDSERGLGNNTVFAIAEDKIGNILFGTYNGGVTIFDGKKLSPLKGFEGKSVFCIMLDRSGNEWFGTYGDGIYKQEGNVLTNYKMEQGLAGNIINCIFQDKDGIIWIGTNESGVSRFDGRSFINYSTKEGLASNIITCINQDLKGNIWFGTEGAGISVFNGATFTSLSTNEGLSNNIVRTITRDNYGNLWIGTNNKISIYQGNAVSKLTAQGLSNCPAYNILEDRKKNIWVATEGNGAIRYNGKDQFLFSKNNILPSNNIFSLFEDSKGKIWIGTSGGGLTIIDDNEYTTISEKNGFLNNMVRTFSEDKEGNMWIGTDGGIACKKGDSIFSYTINQGLPSNNIWSLLQDNKGNFWITTRGSGVTYFDKKTFTNYTKTNGLSERTVFCAFEDDDNNIWFGTSGGGVCRFDGKTFLAFTTEQGMADDAVYDIIQDKKGNIIFGTNQGITYLTGFKGEGQKDIAASNNLSNQLINKYTPKFNHYNRKIGIPIDDIKVNALYCDKAGKIWCGTSTSAIKLDLSEIKELPIPDKLVIQNLKLNNENVPWYTLVKDTSSYSPQDYLSALRTEEINLFKKSISDERRKSIKQKYAGITFDQISAKYPIPQNLALPYEHNNVSFDFIAIEPTNNFLISYQYYLEGLEKSWNPVTNNTAAYYGNIQEGAYTFKVRAKSISSSWSEPVIYSFTVFPPWWRTWWMYFVYSLLFISIIVLAVWSNGRRLQKLAKNLQQKVKKATQEINNQKDQIEQKHKEITDSINYAERIQRSFLATKELLDKNLKDYFVFFQPKDVVSGDFYWASNSINGNFKFVTADSTGHGVPGAIMSLLNITSLENAIKQHDEPAAILNSTRQTIIERLKKDGSVEGGKDGMDCSLICFDFVNKKITYAAANNPVWVVRKDELIELASDKMPVGKHDRDTVPFNQYEFEILKGDMVYTLTDGMPDQFGGPKRKKFMYKQLKQLVVSISGEPMAIQKQKLAEVLKDWKGDLEQVDDITLVGVRV